MNNDPNFLNPQQYSSPAAMQGKTQTLGLDFNIAGLLCYVPFGFIPAIIFLLNEPKESRFVRFHAMQSLLFAAAVFVVSIVLTILGTIAGFIPVVGWLFALLLIPIFLIISLGALALSILLIIKAYNYQMWRLPVIGQQAEKLSA